jgi:hypothetical protein
MEQARRNVLRGFGAIAATAAMLAVSGGGAWAHECFNASRSDRGNEAVAEHSNAWFEASLHTVLTEFIGLPADLAACVEAAAPAAGIPDSFVFGGKQSASTGVIAANNPNMTAEWLAADGRGIDHGEAAYGAILERLIGDCLAG